MKVIGTVKIRYEVDIEAEDIATDAMDLYESDLLIAEAIDRKLPIGMWVESDVFVSEIKK
jgi:hypothetical protein